MYGRSSTCRSPARSWPSKAGLATGASPAKGRLPRHDHGPRIGLATHLFAFKIRLQANKPALAVAFPTVDSGNCLLPFRFRSEKRAPHPRVRRSLRRGVRMTRAADRIAGRNVSNLALLQGVPFRATHRAKPVQWLPSAQAASLSDVFLPPPNENVFSIGGRHTRPRNRSAHDLFEWGANKQ